MFDCSDYLDVANELAQRSGDEAALRTAIGRAYYATFGTARDSLVRSGARIPNAGPAHSIVWVHFHATPDRVHRRITHLGRRLRKRRGLADYDSTYAQASVDARKAVAWARQLLADLARIP